MLKFSLHLTVKNDYTHRKKDKISNYTSNVFLTYPQNLIYFGKTQMILYFEHRTFTSSVDY